MSKDKKFLLSEFFEAGGYTSFEESGVRNCIENIFSDTESDQEDLFAEGDSTFWDEPSAKSQRQEREKDVKAMGEGAQGRLRGDEAQPIAEKLEKPSDKQQRSGVGFMTVAERVIGENGLLCHNNQLHYFDGCCYRKLNDKIALEMIFGEMTKEQVENYWVAKNARGIMDYLQNRADIDLQINQVEPSREVVSVRNGNLNLMTGEFFDSTPEIITTYAVQADYLWEDDTEDLETPVWDDFIISAIDGDPEEVLDFMNTILGYLLCPSVAAKKFFVLGTAPDSGKSVIGEFLEILLRAENVSNLPLDEFGSRFSTANLVGKVLNLNMDLPDRPISSTAVSRIKQLTGRDTITVEKKYMNPWEYKNGAKLVFGTNSPIRLTRQNEAFFRRMIVIPFNHSVPEEDQDTELLKKLLREKDKIVTKALRAAIRLYNTDFVFPQLPASEAMLAQWRGAKNDSVERFIQQCCVKTDDQNDFASSERCYQVYEDFCDDFDLRPVDMKMFVQEMKKEFPGKRASFITESGRFQPRGFSNIILLAE